MPKQTAYKDAGVDAVTVTPAAGTAPNGAYLAALVAVNGKTTAITAADRVAVVNADEVSTTGYAAYARVRLEAADFAALTSSGANRRRAFPVADKLFAALGTGESATIISWAVCNHATNPLSTSCMFVPDTEFSVAYASGDQPKAAAGSLHYEE